MSDTTTAVCGPLVTIDDLGRAREAPDSVYSRVIVEASGAGAG